MDDKTKDLLEEEIEGQIRNLGNLKTGSPEHSAAVDNLTKLYKLKIEETKNERDYRKECENEVIAEREYRLKRDQLDVQIKDRYWKYGVEIGLALLTLAFYSRKFDKGLKFEENGTYTSKTFLNLFNRIKPTRN